jgi:amidase
MPDLVGLGIDGPLTRTVADAALLLDVMTGNQDGDMYTQPPLPPGETFLGYARRDPGRLRIGRTRAHPVGDGAVHPECVAAYEEASELLASLGHEVVDMDPPFGPDVVPAFETLWYSMATLAPLEPAQEEMLRPLTSYLRERGKAMSAADLVFAQAFLQIVVRGAWKSLNEYDVVLTPTLAQPPAPVGWFEEVDPPENFERQKRFTPFTPLCNVSGQPAVSLPLHWTDGGLPIGVMLAGRMGDEATLISLSAQIEAARPWRDRRPSLW